MLTKENDRALKALKKAIATDSNFDDAYVNIANVYSDKKDHTEAANWFKRAFTISKKPHSGRLSSYMHELQCLGMSPIMFLTFITTFVHLIRLFFIIIILFGLVLKPTGPSMTRTWPNSER